MNLKTCISRALYSGGAALAVAMISGLLSLVLRALGDRTGAEAVRGVMLVMLAVFALALVTLVCLLSLAELRRPDPPPPDRQNP